MAQWTVQARVTDLGIVDMGADFMTYQGVKVVMPDGKRKFLGKVIMHNEVNSVFLETQGEFVELHLSGPGTKNYPALLFGMKTRNEDVYRKASPFAQDKAKAFLMFLASLPLCFLLIGLVMLPYSLWYSAHLSSWDPAAQKLFDAHVFDADEGASQQQAEGPSGRQAA